MATAVEYYNGEPIRTEEEILGAVAAAANRQWTAENWTDFERLGRLMEAQKYRFAI